MVGSSLGFVPTRCRYQRVYLDKASVVGGGWLKAEYVPPKVLIGQVELDPNLIVSMTV